VQAFQCDPAPVYTVNKSYIFGAMLKVYGFSDNACEAEEPADDLPRARVAAAMLASQGLLPRIYAQRVNRWGDTVETLVH
jgi:hypothetical protein